MRPAEEARLTKRSPHILWFLVACTVPNPAYNLQGQEGREAGEPSNMSAVVDAPVAVVPSSDLGLVCVAPGCLAPGRLPGQVAGWSFDDPVRLGAEMANRHTAVPEGRITTTEGPCGHKTAALFSDTGYFSVPHSSDWNLDSGSVDLWLRLPAGLGDRFSGVLTRDAKETRLPGHFSLILDGAKRFGMRIQAAGTVVMLCSHATLVENQWLHVAVNFGAPGAELYVNGQRQMGVGSFGGEACGTNAPAGIAGNANPWAIGANTWFSQEGQSGGVSEKFVGGAVDHIRITSQRHDWSQVQACLQAP